MDHDFHIHLLKREFGDMTNMEGTILQKNQEKQYNLNQYNPHKVYELFRQDQLIQNQVQLTH